VVIYQDVARSIQYLEFRFVFPSRVLPIRARIIAMLDQKAAFRSPHLGRAGGFVRYFGENVFIERCLAVPDALSYFEEGWTVPIRTHGVQSADGRLESERGHIGRCFLDGIQRFAGDGVIGRHESTILANGRHSGARGAAMASMVSGIANGIRTQSSFTGKG
jgi:hypothetical protein